MLLKDKNQLFIGLSETWLKGHTMAELEISGYKLYRADRKGRKHTRVRYSGGAALYLRSDIAATSDQILSFSNGVVEALATYSHKENLLICVIYRQPDNSTGGHRSQANELNEALEELTKAITIIEGTPDLVMCGDYNLPHAKWSNPADTPICRIHETMKSFQDKHFLHQVVHKPTHRSGNTLDLVFTNNRSLINDVSCHETAMSDHHIIEITTHFKSNFARTQRKQRKFYNTFDTLNFFSDDVDWNQIKSELNQVNLQDKFSTITDPADKLDKFTKICESIAAKYTPKKKVAKVAGKSKIPRERRILMRRRRKITNQLTKHQPPTMRRKLSRRSR